MGTFNTAKMQDLRNLNTDGPTGAELSVAPFPVMLLAGEKDAVLSLEHSSAPNDPPLCVQLIHSFFTF